MPDIVYDIEVYPNVFTISFLDPTTNQTLTFEMSDWKDDWAKFRTFTKKCQNSFVRWVGFNNFYYDYQVLHKLMQHLPFADMKDKAAFAFKVSDKLINLNKEEKFNHIVWQHEHIIPQVDLFRIHHFDNLARATSLKKLEFNMQSSSIIDLPYKPGTILTAAEKNNLIVYNLHDVRETEKFRQKSLDMIRFRDELTQKYGKDFTNHNDTKIGKDYFIMELQNAEIKCFRTVGGERQPVQTIRNRITVKDIIFDYIKFERPEFNAVLDWLKKQVITQTKGVFTEIDDLGSLKQYANLTLKNKKIKNLNCIVDGFQFDFGTGGIHGSVESTIVEEDEGFAIIDYDVTSLYPSIAIVNNVYPEHLTEEFCKIYAWMKKERLSYPKGTPENAMLKLALNGVYGDSNNPYSCFYDSKYTMTITINGQLMLCMLAEKMLGVEGLEIVQINTDGITVRAPRARIDEIEQINREWEAITKLELERADYSKMFIRDVNNYIGLYTNGKVKRKGAYEHQLGWNQDHSALVVQKAVESHLVSGTDISKFICDHDNDFDFMLRTNVPRSSRLLMYTNGKVEQLQNVTRYYMSDTGGELLKIMPALNGKDGKPRKIISEDDLVKIEIRLRDNVKLTQAQRQLLESQALRKTLGLDEFERVIKINDGYQVTPMNDMGVPENINYGWYIAEARKMVDPLWAGYINDLLS